MTRVAVHGHLSEPEVYNVHDSFTLDTALDALLRFRDRRLEAAFWACNRDWLCGIDQIAAIVVLANNTLAISHASWLLREGTIGSAVYVVFTASLVGFTVVQLIVLWLASCHREAYYLWRNVIVAACRVSRYLLAVYLSIMAERGQDVFAASYVLSTPPPVSFALAKALAFRGWLYFSLFFSFFWPLRLSHHAVLHTFGLVPVMLHAAKCLARDMLQQPALQQPVCALASVISLRLLQAGDCHPRAPQLVAYSVSSGLCSALF